MAYKYCTAIDSGKGFFTARERMEFHLSGHPGDVWVVGDNLYGNAWIKRVGGNIKTKSEAQAIVDAKITAAQESYDTLTDEQKIRIARPTSITLK
tara:strand:- start:1114 stop:1398 length:285 start_codon:yes stop_codon:yes gene_type:complete